jgi:CHAT domain-containing protein/tetratricopeptide (TPR) repeat protein
MAGSRLRRSFLLGIQTTFLILLVVPILGFPQEKTARNTRPRSPRIQLAEVVVEAEKAVYEGKFEEALELFSQAFSIAQKTRDEEGEMDCLVQQGFLYWNLGRMKESSEAFARALPIAERLQVPDKQHTCSVSLEIYDLYVQGKERRDSRDYQTSIEKFKRACDLAKTIQGKGQELKCLRQWSLNYWELKDFQEFFLLNKRGLAIAQEIKHKQEEGRCLNNIGLFYWQIDDYTEALSNYEKALEIARSGHNLEEENNCLTNIAAIYMDLGNYDRALEYSIQALDSDRKLKDPANISKDLNNIGTIFIKRGTTSEQKESFRVALKYYNESFKIATAIKETATEIKVLNNIGSVYSYLGEYAKSLDYFQSALKKAQQAQDAEEMSIILNNIGIVYSHLGNFEESTRYYQRVIDLASEIKGIKVLWEAYFEIANAYKNRNLLPAALENYRKSISVIENIRSSINLEELRATYLGTDKRIDAYHNLIALFIRLYKESHESRYAADAFRYLEKAKARAFLDSIEVSKLDLSKGIGQQLLNKETDLMNEISQLHTKLLVPQLSQAQRDKIDQELARREEQLEALRREVREVSPAYANLRFPRTLTLQEAQSELLDEETACFAYLLAKEKSYGFAITRKNIKIFPLPGKKEIQKMVQEYLKAITDVTNQDFGLGHKLFEALIQPGLSGRTRRLIIVPDDVLYFLPFETLLSKDEGRDWLVKDYTIAYAPSLSSLRELVVRKRANGRKTAKDILAVGDPSYGANEVEPAAGSGSGPLQESGSPAEAKFFRLKFSGQEIDKISALFKPGRRDTLLRDRASEENFKHQNLADYRIIHFATHAFIDDKKPARSAIVLSLDQDPKEDGFLQMREVFNLKLKADLVVLSACQTGLGQLIRGEGIEGLSRAFFYAGASSVLLSLWAVNDQASYQLLERFYIHLRSANPVMDSLRQAKLEMIDSGVLAHPYYWAGFVVAGNADTIIFHRSLNKWTLVTLSLCAGLAILLLVIKREKPASSRPQKSLGRRS